MGAPFSSLADASLILLTPGAATRGHARSHLGPTPRPGPWQTLSMQGSSSSSQSHQPGISTAQGTAAPALTALHLLSTSRSPAWEATRWLGTPDVLSDPRAAGSQAATEGTGLRRSGAYFSQPVAERASRGSRAPTLLS